MSAVSPPARPLSWYRVPGLLMHTVASDFRYYERSADRPRRIRGAWAAADAPVFIVGAPRSGTTFVGACIGQLPEVSYHFEPVATKAFAPYLAEEGPALWRRRYRWVYAGLVAMHCDGGLRFVEKTPRNALVVPQLADMFPRSRFLHLIRDGRDVAVSWSEKPWLREGRRRKYEPGGYRYGDHPRMWTEPDRLEDYLAYGPARRAAWGWRRMVSAARSAGQNLGPDRYIELRYEDVALSPERSAFAVARLLGLMEPAAVQLSDAFASMRHTSIGRWRADLSESELSEVMDEIGGLLAETGYM